MLEEKGSIFKLLKIDKLFQNLTGYIETQIELIKLDLKEQAEGSMFRLIQMVLILMLMFVFLIFLSIAIAISINILTESKIFGYLFMALLYLIAMLGFILDKKSNFGKWIYKRFIESNKDNNGFEDEK